MCLSNIRGPGLCLSGHVATIQRDRQRLGLNWRAPVEASIMQAGESFLTSPMEAPFMPNWNRVASAIPDFGEQLLDAVAADND